MMDFIYTGGKKIHFAELNPAGVSTVIMIHGMMSNLSVFYLKSAPILARDFRVILYDLRSHGLSGRSDEGYSPEILFYDLLELMDCMGVKEAGLVGHSFGGLVVMYAAASRPDIAQCISIIDTPSMHEPEFDAAYQTVEDFEALVEEYMRSMNVVAPKSMVTKTAERYAGFLGGGKYMEAIRDARRLLIKTPPETIGVPSLLLYGAQSHFADAGLGYKERIPGAVLAFEDGNHNLPITQGEWVGERLLAFFGEWLPYTRHVAEMAVPGTIKLI